MTPPSLSADPLVEVAPDPELGNEAFTYQLSSGAEGTIHVALSTSFDSLASR